ncbi:hypothetical protein FS842_009342 [Serendipita sp. 407]|nr:hypothetical protein FRC18_003679 [Serendipita sp. 400]KAG9052728.1 hypothetical protein FS842_009342 [Serendipita sp. 407]
MAMNDINPHPTMRLRSTLRFHHPLTVMSTKIQMTTAMETNEDEDENEDEDRGEEFASE